MLFPISDDDRALIRPAYVTSTLLVVNVVVFVFLQLPNEEFTRGWSATPHELVMGQDLVGWVTFGGVAVLHAEGPNPIGLTLLSSMFMHGDWVHLGGNMLYLWIFGDNVEHRFGHWKFLGFYLASGICASLFQIFLAPDSMIPTLGASGAISGILGAYLVLFPRNKVMAIVLIRIMEIPAVVVLGMWIAMQIFLGAGTIGSTGTEGGIAYGAHIGGFLAGVVSGGMARMMMREEPRSAFRNRYSRNPKVKRYW